MRGDAVRRGEQSAVLVMRVLQGLGPSARQGQHAVELRGAARVVQRGACAVHLGHHLLVDAAAGAVVVAEVAELPERLAALLVPMVSADGVQLEFVRDVLAEVGWERSALVGVVVKAPQARRAAAALLPQARLARTEMGGRPVRRVQQA